MPSYTLKPKNPYHAIFIGWDDALNTYFLHIVDSSEDEDSPLYDLIWLGGHYGEVQDESVIYEKVMPYVDEIPDIIKRKIHADANG